MHGKKQPKLIIKHLGRFYLIMKTNCLPMKRLDKLPRLLFVAIFIAIMVSCGQHSVNNPDHSSTTYGQKTDESLNANNKPQIYFQETEHNLGEIMEGEIITYGVKFSNTGNADLIISNVITSCGCTVGKFPQKPIKPGETGVIELTFDSSGETGYQNKTITVETNTLPNKVFLRLKATVKNS